MEEDLQSRLVSQLRRSSWIKRRVIYRSLMENELNLKNRAEFKKAFMFLDVDSDGFISVQDFIVVASCMEGENVGLLDVYRWIRMFDMNQDGKIGFEEFAATLLVKMENFMTPKDVLQLFTKCDASDKGYITANGVMKASARAGKDITIEDAKIMLNGAGIKCKGKVDFVEFSRIMEIMRKDILFLVGSLLSTS